MFFEASVHQWLVGRRLPTGANSTGSEVPRYLPGPFTPQNGPQWPVTRRTREDGGSALARLAVNMMDKQSVDVRVDPSVRWQIQEQRGRLRA